jgi:hypothetical protein
MPTITVEDLESYSPDLILPPAEDFAGSYESLVRSGRSQAKHKRVAFVAICRNAMPFLPRTLGLVAKTGEMFKEWKCFVYENDSVDGTKDVLHQAAKQEPRISYVSLDNSRPHLNYTKTSDRTVPLAEYRNACRDWCYENAKDFDYCVVFDTDPWGGWSIDGIATTISYLESLEYAHAAGMGSYSWCEWGPPVWNTPTICQYDAWACRWNWWNERQNMIWFHLWHPPVGSPPVKMNSCFGQLGVYRMGNYLAGQYRGGDCEHVHHWRTCGGDCYLNPSQRVVSFWTPKDVDEQSEGGRMHGDVHEDVAGRDAYPDHCRNSQDIG